MQSIFTINEFLTKKASKKNFEAFNKLFAKFLLINIV